MFANDDYRERRNMPPLDEKDKQYIAIIKIVAIIVFIILLVFIIFKLIA